MSPPRDTQDPVRVFLTADTPELLIHLHLLEEALAETDGVHLQAHLIEPLETAPVPSRTGTRREMREGDVLIALVFAPSTPAAQLVATVERARRRQLLLLPFHAPGSDVFIEPFANHCPRTTSFDPTAEPATFVRAAVATLLDTLRLVSPHTDLLGRPIKNGESALALLRQEPASGGHQIGDAARESRQQAARAIEARLFEPALAALARAGEFDTTSAITAYWRARLLAATGDFKELDAARLEATRAARLASDQGTDQAIRHASWWMLARIAALTGEKDALLEALAETGTRPTSPLESLLPALRFLTLGGFRDTALAWLTEAVADDVSVLDSALEDPLLTPLAPTLRDFRETHHTHLLEILVPLLVAEKKLYATWTNGSQNALDAFSQAAREDWKSASLHRLQAAVQDALLRQLDELNRWSEELISDILEARQARSLRDRLIESDEAVPDPNSIDRILEGCWPRLREKRYELEAALRDSDREVKRLLQREQAIGASMRERLQSFLACAQRFEEIALRAPEQVAAINARAKMQGEPLRVAAASELEAEGVQCDPLLLPDALAAFLESAQPTLEGPALFRLESHRQAGPVASRTGVYFHRAYRRSGWVPAP